MNKYMWHILCVAMLCVTNAYATVLVLANGNSVGTPATLSATASAPRTFIQEVISKVYDPAHGRFFVGLNKDANATTDKEKTYALSYVSRFFGNTAPSFTPIATNSILKDHAIIMLALAAGLGDDKPNIAGVASSSTQPETTPQNKKVFICDPEGVVVGLSEDLKDANPILDEDGNACKNIYTIAANKNFIFATVARDTTLTTSDGIAIVAIDLPTLSLRQTAAVPSDSGIKAIPLNGTTAQLNIAPGANTDLAFENTKLHLDNPLQRLYIGLEILTGSYGGKTIIVSRVDNEGALYYNNIAPDSAFNASLDLIVGTTAAAENFTAIKIRTLHASTGPDYLIINGGHGDITQVNNTIYALPLVNNPSNLSTHGTIANTSSPLTNGVFTVPALLPVDMPTNSDSAVLVGAGPLPALSSSPISDINVVGDTVYVSYDGTQSSSNETGIFYSQALFDETGKILAWTPWAKRALVFNAFPSGAPRGRVKFFSVDASNGKIWAVEAGESADDALNVDGKVVISTEWDRGSSESTLAAQLNSAFRCGGCYSVLDLDQSTRAFTGINNLINRYALFGSANSVAFARVSVSINNPATMQSPQTIISDFTDPQNFLVTQLPAKSGSVTSLEYSRTFTSATTDTGYFFAGTEKGLFVFCDQGLGFDLSTLSTLNAAPFSTGGWQKAPNISGSIVDIKTTGRRLYVMTFETTKKAPLTSKIYAINFMDNVDDMFDPSNIDMIAQSGVGTFSKALIFNGMAILPTGDATDPAGKEQLVIATSQGMFRSNADQTLLNGMIDATDQTTAAWQLIAGGTTLFTDMYNLDPQDVSPPSTMWATSVQNGFPCKKTLCRSNVHQFSGSANPAGTAVLTEGFDPANFNSIETGNPAFINIDPITAFWTDGARRFFAIQRTKKNGVESDLLVMPFNTFEWQVKNPETQILGDPAIVGTKTIYWIHDIGATGIIMAGVNNGVIALE